MLHTPYQIKHVNIPQEKREELNKKVLHIIDNNLNTKISKNDVFNVYTGRGHLHGLSFNDFDSYHAFSKAKQLEEEGEFYTPYELSRFVIQCLKPSNDMLIADLTAGHGSFINWLQAHYNVYANELNMNSYKVLKYLYPNVNATHGDIREFITDLKFDLILGNSPYNLDGFSWEGKRVTSQHYYNLKAASFLKPGALLSIVVPRAYLSDEFTNKGDIEDINKRFNYITALSLPNNAFKHVGIDNYQTKIMFFQRKSEHLENKPYTVTEPLHIGNYTEQTAEKIYNTFIKVVTEQAEQLKSKIYLETIQAVTNDNKEAGDFEYKVKKLLYDIKVNPVTKLKYSKCLEQVERLKSQTKPDGMEIKEWMKVRATPKKVLSYLKRVLREQNKQERDIIKLVKNDTGLSLKAYSHKTKLQLSKMDIVKEMSFNEMVLNSEYPFEDKTYEKLVTTNIKQYQRQNKKFNEMEQDVHIEKFLSDFSVTDHSENRTIKLNEIQRNDINLLLQKKSGFLQWDTGTGKSLATIAFSQYHLQNSNIKNAFIIAPAIAINGTFDPNLTNYKIPFINIRTLKDIENIQHGQIVIITFNMLIKYQHQLKNYIRNIGNKIAVTIDESDNICNIQSKRCKAVFNTCRKAKYKMLTTGTSVRNAIYESFTQFSFLLGQSPVFTNYCKEIYTENQKTKELETKVNPNYMKPYPMYTKGLKSFRESHSPFKQTVFGANQNTQHIYNSQILKELIDRTIITRTFEEVTGRSISTIIQHTCEFNANERALYKTIVEEFYKMGRAYKTGNSRKDAMLQIIAQLNTLIKCCSASHLFKECVGNGISEKFKKVFSMIEEWEDEHIVIGCRFKKTVYSYVNHIKQRFPNRKVFVVTGEDTTVKRRKEIAEEMKKHKGSILVCTQQSLSSSVSINFVDKIIISEMGWNSATLKQFYARFIRFDSVSDNKEVHFVNYANSIESNLLRLILSKEAFGLFMQNEEVEEEELNSRFGVDFDILDMLMTKEYDSLTGRSYMKWGEQNIV